MSDATASPVVGLPAPDPALIPVATAAGAAALALSSHGSLVVAALLLAIAAGRRAGGVALALAVASVGIRFATVSLDDLAGLQSVLGMAGRIEPATGAAASWCAAGAVIAVGAVPGRWSRVVPSPDAAVTGGGDRWARCVTALASGALAAAVVAGPGPSDLALRAAATAVGLGVALVVGTARGPRVDRARVVVGVVAGLAAVVLAAVPA